MDRIYDFILNHVYQQLNYDTYLLTKQLREYINMFHLFMEWQ